MVEIDSDHRVMTKNRQKLVWDTFWHILMGFSSQNKFRLFSVFNQTREIVENPRFWLFLKKSIFDDFGRLVRPETMEIYNFRWRNRV